MGRKGKRQDQPVLPLNEVDRVMRVLKLAIAAPDWVPGIAKSSGQWLKWTSALEVDGEIPEGLHLVFQYRFPYGAAPEKLNLSLLHKGERIYGIDYDPFTRHTNTAGRDRPYYGQRLEAATHEHTWSVDGYGYAEPLDMPIEGLIDRFCCKAHVGIEGGCRLPSRQQFSLGLL